MPVSLPYIKQTQAPSRLPGMQRGSKMKNLWRSQGPKPIQAPPNYAEQVPQQLFQPQQDRGPMTPRASYIRFLKQSSVNNPEGMAPDLLQTLQGGGEPLDPLRRILLRQIAKGWF